MVSAHDLWHDQKYKNMGISAKVVYQFLIDKLEENLSRGKLSYTENNDAFIIYPVYQIAKDTGLSRVSVIRACAELKKAKLFTYERKKSNSYKIILPK